MIYTLGKIRTKSRVKSVSTAVPQSEDRNYPSLTLNNVIAPAQSFVTASKTEVITYTTRNRKRPWLANACLHSKIYRTVAYQGPIITLRNTIANPSMKQINHSYPSATGTALDLANTAVGLALADTSYGSGFLFKNGQALMDQNFDSMRPDMTEVSLPNFLWELGQLKSLVSFWNIRRRSFQRASKTAPASANLWYQYGVRPTVGDISAMIHAIRSLSQKLKDWNDRLGELTQSRKKVFDDVVTLNGLLDAPSIGSTFKIRWRATVNRKCYAFILFRPLPILVMNDLDLVLRATLDSLGVELNPEIIWDAIPFSFVVDWFVNVGALLRRFKVDALELPIRMEDSFLQYKEELSIDTTLVRTDPTGLNFPNVDYPSATLQRNLFHRLSFQPGWGNLLNLGWKLPSLNQAGLGASIVVQMLAK